MKRPQMQKTHLDGVILETVDKGSGEPVVLIHGSMGDECPPARASDEESTTPLNQAEEGQPAPSPPLTRPTKPRWPG
jgi:hypothetical protein